MDNKKLNAIIYILSGIVIGLLVAFIVVLAIQGNEKKYEKAEDTPKMDFGNPIEYFNNVEKSEDENILKEGFTNVVDFLFYGKEIKGKTLSDLKDDAKLKIMKTALFLDEKIESKFPDYKKTISDKYQNIKLKVVESYISITTSICENNEQLCIDAKRDFNSLKESFGITFDYVKKYGIKGLDKLKEWYEDFRD